MAGTLSGAKFLSALILDTLSVSRRGYAVASQGAVTATSGAATARMGKSAKEEAARSAENAWVPDPVTGYYRPENRANEIDVAELREWFLKERIRSQ